SPVSAGGGTLPPDKRRPVRMAVLVQPVGEDQPRQVVVRTGGDGGQKRPGVAQCRRSRWRGCSHVPMITKAVRGTGGASPGKWLSRRAGSEMRADRIGFNAKARSQFLPARSASEGRVS